MLEGFKGNKAAFFAQDTFKKDESKTAIEPMPEGSVGDKAAWLAGDAFKKDEAR